MLQSVPTSSAKRCTDMNQVGYKSPTLVLSALKKLLSCSWSLLFDIHHVTGKPSPYTHNYNHSKPLVLCVPSTHTTLPFVSDFMMFSCRGICIPMTKSLSLRFPGCFVPYGLYMMTGLSLPFFLNTHKLTLVASSLCLCAPCNPYVLSIFVISFLVKR